VLAREPSVEQGSGPLWPPAVDHLNTLAHRCTGRLPHPRATIKASDPAALAPTEFSHGAYVLDQQSSKSVLTTTKETQQEQEEVEEIQVERKRT
jgi:hypothetical protein